MRAGTYFSLQSGRSETYNVGATVWGIGISSQTMYNSTHTQKIEAGDHEGEHDIWGARGTLSGKPGAFYSY